MANNLKEVGYLLSPYGKGQFMRYRRGAAMLRNDHVASRRQHRGKDLLGETGGPVSKHIVPLK